MNSTVWVLIVMRLTRFLGLIALALSQTANAANESPAADVANIALRAVPSPLLAIDRNRNTVIDRIVGEWGDALVKSNAGIDAEQLRALLMAMRADQLLAASLAGSLEGLRNVVASALVSEADVKPSLLHAKALGDANQDVVYVPVTPCRLVETRGTFAAVYQGGGPFAPTQLRTYTLQGGNGVCLTQLPASVSPSAIQLQVFGIPTTTGSGDIEILPQGAAFGNTATLVYLGNNVVTSAAATSLVNLANKQIGVQVRGGGAHVAIDVVGYFKPTVNSATGAFEVALGGSLALQIRPDATSPILIAGSSANTATAGASGASIGGGGAAGTTVVGLPCGSSCANRVTDAFGTIGGGAGNQAGDGSGTTIDRAFATVGGGFKNAASGVASIVGGGSTNTASNTGTTVGGGLLNGAVGGASTIAGGSSNTASGFSSTVGGGQGNSASDDYSAVGGGLNNGAGGPYSAIAGGSGNFANSPYSAVAGGEGNSAINFHSTVAGGKSNTASGVLSFAAGNSANADADGCFVWNDGSGGSVSCGGPVTGNNRVVMRATGGFIFLTHPSNSFGAQLLPGAGAWSIYSDRGYKDHMRDIDARLILDQLVALPIATWNWKSQDAQVRHMGPTAQDFHAAFGLGETPTTINTVDVSGVALAAIKGLNAKLEAEIGAQAREIADLKRAMEALMARTAPDTHVAAK